MNVPAVHVFDSSAISSVSLSRAECCVTSLGRYLQTQPSHIRFAYNAFGEPDLSAEFGNRLKFNLSHSAGLALIAIATTSNVGVDLEYIRAQSDYADIARRFFSPAEADYLMALPSHLYAEALFSCWTKKEAYLKAPPTCSGLCRGTGN